jgi:hypothetical protein
MADVTRSVRPEMMLDFGYLEDALFSFWRTRIPLAMEARRRQLEEADGEKLADYYKMLVEMRNQTKVLADRAITAGSSAQTLLGRESAARQGLEGTFRRTAGLETVAKMQEAGKNIRQMREQAKEEYVTGVLTTDERDEIDAAMENAQERFTNTQGNYNERLANAMGAAKAATEKLVKGKSAKHADAIAYAIAQQMQAIVNPGSGDEQIVFDAAMLSIYGAYGISPIRDPETGEMVPASASASKLMIRRQNSIPNSRSGMRSIRPVWISVRLSNISSSVPNPPGKMQTAAARIRKCILRMAK